VALVEVDGVVVTIYDDEEGSSVRGQCRQGRAQEATAPPLRDEWLGAARRRPLLVVPPS
jgi:hypothetical protein